MQNPVLQPYVFKIIRPDEASETDMEAGRGTQVRLVDASLTELNTHRDEPVGPIDAASYAYLPLYWKEPGRHPFFIDVPRGQGSEPGELPAGFVLIREVASQSHIEMSEFYVRPESRRIGVGRAALEQVWQRFPGSWRLTVHARNIAGSEFWHRCIHELASGGVVCREILDEDGRRHEYAFEIKEI